MADLRPDGSGIIRLRPVAHPIVKAIAEKRFVLGIAYQPGRDPLIKRGADGYHDFFTEDELEETAWSFLKSDRQIGIHHVDGTVGAATAVESFINRSSGWLRPNGEPVPVGSWVLGAICEPPAWVLVKSGLVTGFSPDGTGRRRLPQ